jgi:hypothetical protein
MISQVPDAKYVSSLDSDIARLRLAPTAVEDLHVVKQDVAVDHDFSCAAIGKSSGCL